MQQEQNQMSQNYSLQADIATGWKPKMKIIGPMPLNFDNPALDNLIKPLIYSETSIHQIVYLGLRPRDTFEMHSFLSKNYKYKFRHLLTTDYSHLKPFFRKFYSQFEPQYKMPFNGMNPKINSNILFESRFQSGNLDCVVKTRSNQYDLFLRIDSNTKGHIMWYYFKVSNRLDKSRTIRLNICNLRKSKTFYDNCMKPYIYREGAGWNQEANNLVLSEDKIIFYKQHLIFSNETIQEPETYRKLSFDLQLKPHQEVQVAYCVPYTYSRLLQDIRQLKSEARNIQNLQFQIDTTNISLSGLEIPYIKIYKNNEKMQYSKKQAVFIIGRQHPGESNGSHVLKGFMDQLIKSKQKAINQLRENFVFHIIPMLNPDGVVVGNFRTSLYGKDLNRLFRKNHTLMIPQIQFCRNLSYQITRKKKRKMFMFLDFHGHSVKKNVFCYAPGTFQTNSLQDIRQFPKLISQVTEIFRFPSCSFRISTHKKSTARAVFSVDYNLCYTIQASNWSYYSKSKKQLVLFNNILWEKFGHSLINSLGLFYSKIIERKQLRRKKIQSKIQNLSILKHNTSGLIRNKLLKKINIKTQQNSQQFQNQSRTSKNLNNMQGQFVERLMPSSTRSVHQVEYNKKIDFKNVQNGQRLNKLEQDEMQQNKQIQQQNEDSDESDHEDMQKQKFKKYINVATRMFIQFEKAYYGDEYSVKARYQLPKKIIKKEEKKRQIPIMQQACLRPRAKQERKTLESQKILMKIGYSEQKTNFRSRLKKLQQVNKKGTILRDLQTPKEQNAKTLPKINFVNYLAYQDIDQKYKNFKIPKIESMQIKSIKKC